MIKVAQIQLYPPGGEFNTIGQLGQNPGSDPGGTLAKILTMVVGVLTIVATIWFLFKLITGALAILTSGGDKGKLADAKASITYGLVGLFIVFSATIFVGFIGAILGINLLDIAGNIGILLSL